MPRIGDTLRTRTANGSVRVYRALPGPDPDAPLIFIDGARATAEDLERLTPDAVKSIEVIKGNAAARLYADPGAKNGVIRISTRE